MNREDERREKGKKRSLILLAGLAVGMFGFGFALVPLYGVLCKITGTPSIEQRSSVQATDAPTTLVSDPLRRVTVKFDATVQPALPWEVTPQERRLQVQPGQTYEVRFTATNNSSRAVVGQAIPNIVPWQATPYFSKLECFCFRQQTLQPGETREMMLRFVVLPDLPAEFQSLALSYSVMRSETQAATDDTAGDGGTG